METKVENFKRISEARTTKIKTLLEQMKNLSNSSFYEYTDEEVTIMFDEIQRCVEESRRALLRGNERKRRNRRIVL